MPPGVRIRPPRDEEGPACRMLAPDDLQAQGDREMLIAVSNSPPYILAAARYSQGHKAIFGIRLRVVRTHRRQGIGRALLEEIAGIAHHRDGTALMALSESVSEPDAAPFLAACGFEPAGGLSTVEAPMDGACAVMLPLAARLRATGRAPLNSTMVSIAEAPREEIARLYVEYLAANRNVSPLSMERTVKHPDFARSLVMMVAGRVAGFLLWKIADGTAVVPARVVLPEWRRGATNALLIAAGVEAAAAAGVERIRFEIPAGNDDTAKLARRFGGAVTRTRDQWSRRLGGAAGQSV